MRELETDYLVVGAGASGMAFVDALLHHGDGDVVLVDRRHRPGGHWLDAYPFVRLHQPSAYYGVDSRTLGGDRIDQHGPNAGFYERATASEICDYFSRVLDEDLLPTGRVRFLGMTDHRGEDADGHHLVNRLDGATTTVRVRRKLVDATYVQSEIPSRHVPGFAVDPDVTLVTPNDLVDLAEPPSRVTVIGAGKTAMDTCNWLLDAGLDPDRIRWVRGRDPWLFDRSFMQPLDLVGSYMQCQASWLAAAATAEDGTDFAHRLEDRGTFVRIDASVEPMAFRGATISQRELASLRTVQQVARARRVTAITTAGMSTDVGDVPGLPDEVYVDCTAAGVPARPARPVFEPGRITLQYVTIGIAPWSAATIGVVEATVDGTDSTGTDDAGRNALCPPVVFTGDSADLLPLAAAGLWGLAARSSHPAVGAWNNGSRLNPARAATEHRDDPTVSGAISEMGQHLGAAFENLARHAPTGRSGP